MITQSTQANVLIRKLMHNVHYAEMQDSNGKHLKWLSKTQYHNFDGTCSTPVFRTSTLDHNGKYIRSDELRKIVGTFVEGIESKPQAKKNYTEQLAEVNTKLDKILRLLEAE